MNNLELKAICDDFDRACEIATEIGASYQWTKEQIDTYFQVPTGKLKLREIDDKAELIAYLRPDTSVEKISDYEIFVSSRTTNLKDTLSKCLPQIAKVVKQRSLYLWHNVRIHLDKVELLGTFIEFEAVIKTDKDEKMSPTHIGFLKNKFNLTNEKLVPVGYFDLLKAKEN